MTSIAEPRLHPVTDSGCLADRFLVWGMRRRLRGMHRLRRWLHRSEVLLPVANRYGVTLMLEPTEYVDGFVLRHGYYESEVIEAVRPYLKPGGVFWDVGANIGLHAMTARRLEPRCDVVCFEPSFDLCRRIRLNARLNRTEVAIVPFALSDASGIETFFSRQGNAGMSGLATWGDPDAYDRELCYRVTADELVARGFVPKPTVVKIDVEGHEVNVLSGMASVLAESPPEAIVIEADPQLLTDASHPIRLVLDAAGFHLERLVRNEPSGHNLENYLATPGRRRGGSTVAGA